MHAAIALYIVVALIVIEHDRPRGGKPYLDQRKLLFRLAQLFPKCDRDLIKQAHGKRPPFHDHLTTTHGDVGGLSHQSEKHFVRENEKGTRQLLWNWIASSPPSKKTMGRDGSPSRPPKNDETGWESFPSSK